MNKKILFFIDSLCSGGRERRLVELLFYLNQHSSYNIRLVLTEYEIHYNEILQLNIQIDVIKRRHIKKDPSLFFRFYKIVKEFKPDIIHTWGIMTTFYAIPSKWIFRKPLMANMIADVKKKHKSFSLTGLFNCINYKYADVILGNTNAGFKAYGIDKKPKIKLIYNGVRLERFDVDTDKEEIKKQMGIDTSFIVIMVASTSRNKDYDFFLDVAKEMSKTRNDITFLGVGGGYELERLRNRIKTEFITNVKLVGRQNGIEKFVAISDIGVLFSHSEGLSNVIIEYMALAKPVITTDTEGGSHEIIEEGLSGFIMKPNAVAIANKINELINNRSLMSELGQRGKQIIKQRFSIERMGTEYVELYDKILIGSRLIIFS